MDFGTGHGGAPSRRSCAGASFANAGLELGAVTVQVFAHFDQGGEPIDLVKLTSVPVVLRIRIVIPIAWTIGALTRFRDCYRAESGIESEAMPHNLVSDVTQWIGSDATLIGVAVLLVAGAWLSEKKRVERSRVDRVHARLRVPREALNNSRA